MAVDELKIGLTFASVTAAPAARLRIESLAGAVRLSWPVHAGGYVLQFTDDLGSSNWQTTTTAPIVVGSEQVITNVVEGRRFFRLEK